MSKTQAPVHAPAAPASAAVSHPNHLSPVALRTAFENLVHAIDCDCDVDGLRVPTSRSLIETEWNGRVYSLHCRDRIAFAPAAVLSPRENEIVRMIAGGFPNKAIAATLDISEWTVGTHVRRIFAKLQVSSRAAMVVRLLALGRAPAKTPAHSLLCDQTIPESRGSEGILAPRDRTNDTLHSLHGGRTIIGSD